jgi:hypothetical protein
MICTPYDLYCSPNIVRVMIARRMKWAEHVARTGDGRGAYIVLLGRPESRRLFGRSTCKLDDNIKMVFPEVG